MYKVDTHLCVSTLYLRIGKHECLMYINLCSFYYVCATKYIYCKVHTYLHVWSFMYICTKTLYQEGYDTYYVQK